MNNIDLKLSNEVQRQFCIIILFGQKQYIFSDKFFGQCCILAGQPEGNASKVLGYCHDKQFCKALMQTLQCKADTAFCLCTVVTVEPAIGSHPSDKKSGLSRQAAPDRRFIYILNSISVKGQAIGLAYM